ncbi:MAG: T9SS type A sorting domain-containing protein [candidate division KSB1 bacterium]|nr:T9SS type A sorting domain-containing protein [candidate division KSB1 bacterium]
MRQLGYLFLVHVIFFGSVPGPNPVQAQVPHLVFGEIRSSTGSIPPLDHIAFEAHMQTRPDDRLTEGHAGQTGLLYDASPPRLLWVVQCSDFTSAWNAGELLVVEVYDKATGESASAEIVLNSEPYQDAGILPLPVRLLLFEAAWQGEEVVIRWQTTDEVECLGFLLWRTLSDEEEWTRVTDGIVPAMGGLGRTQEYRFVDRAAPRGTSCRYRLEEVSRDGTRTVLGIVAVTSPLRQPTAFQLWPLYPNPSGGNSTVRFSLAKESPACVAVVDVRGVTVRVLAEGVLAAGEHLLTWDGTDAQGRKLPAGVYFCRIVTSGEHHVEKLVRTR